jgi:release factor glutamine methyltransferase
MRIASNKITDILRFFRTELKDIYESGEVETFITYCIEEFIGIKRAEIALKSDLTVSESELLKFNFAVKELKHQKPIQYILGAADFYGLKFIVNGDVLIPRPETEELVDLVIREKGEWRREKGEGRTEKGERGMESGEWRVENGEWGMEKGEWGMENGEGRAKNGELGTENPLSILDIGTGSGCIAISLKKNIPAADVYALDISEKALDVAKQNAARNAVNVTFIKHDILSDSAFPVKNIKFNVIVSNPPYIPVSEKAQMENNVIAYEPHQALFIEDKNPLLFYDAITNFALHHLKANGMLYFEINQRFGAETRQLMENKGFKNVVLLKDLNNNYRMVKGHYQP